MTLGSGIHHSMRNMCIQLIPLSHTQQPLVRLLPMAPESAFTFLPCPIAKHCAQNLCSEFLLALRGVIVDTHKFTQSFRQKWRGIERGFGFSARFGPGRVPVMAGKTVKQHMMAIVQPARGVLQHSQSSAEVCARHFVNLTGRKWFVPLAPAEMCMLCLLQSSKDAETCSSVDNCMCSGEIMMLKGDNDAQVLLGVQPETGCGTSRVSRF